MVTGAHRNTFSIQNCTDIVRVDVVEHERQHGRLVGRLANDAQAWNLGCQRGCPVSAQVSRLAILL